MKILITGGAGFIGSHLVEYYQQRSTEILVLDNLRTGHLHNLAGLDHVFIEGSITDRDTVRRAMEGVDLVFHLAAMVSVPESMAKPAECVDLNVHGLLNVLEEAAAAGVRKLVFASSAAVYGNNPAVPKTEDMRPEPQSPYAITKLDGEYYLDLFRRDRGIETAAIRFFNVFGPRQDPNGPYAAAVPIFIEKALRGEDITVYGDGSQTRDFIYVKDIAGALSFAAEATGLHGVFNAGYGEQLTILDLAQKVTSLSGSASNIVHAPNRAGDVKHSRSSPALLQAAGWRPAYSLEVALEETLASFDIPWGVTKK